ncbi:uncharacterized protein LOC111949140 isoform X4 [Oryzias latipes]
MGHAHFFSFSIPNVGFNTLLTLKPLFTYSPHHVREVIEASPPFPGRGCEDIPTFITVERCRGLEERKKGRPITGPLVPLTALADTSENWRPALWAAKSKDSLHRLPAQPNVGIHHIIQRQRNSPH